MPLLCLIVVQLCLRNPETRELFTDIEKQENIEYSPNFNSTTEAVELCLVKGTPGDDIGIFYNGSYICPFRFTSMSISIKCEGVVQIKNDSGQELTVAVKADSQNIEINDINPTINDGISNLCRVLTD